MISFKDMLLSKVLRLVWFCMFLTSYLKFRIIKDVSIRAIFLKVYNRADPLYSGLYPFKVNLKSHLFNLLFPFIVELN